MIMIDTTAAGTPTTPSAAAGTALATAQEALLAPAGLGLAQVERLLGVLAGSGAGPGIGPGIGPGVDLAEVYFEATRSESWRVEDGRLQDAGFDSARGAGLRAVTGERTGFAHASVLELPVLLEAARAARGIAHGCGSVATARDGAPSPYPPPPGGRIKTKSAAVRDGSASAQDGSPTPSPLLAGAREKNSDADGLAPSPRATPSALRLGIPARGEGWGEGDRPPSEGADDGGSDAGNAGGLAVSNAGGLTGTGGLPSGTGALARYGAADPLASLATPAKVEYLLHLEQRIRALDPRIDQVIVTLTGSHSTILVARADGTLAADIRPLVRLQVQVIAAAGGRREAGTYGGGGRYDYPTLIANDRGLAMGREAARLALLNLEAEEAPAGPMTVVLGPGWPGILLHEAIGHGLEGDFNRKGTSAFAGRLGERVASPLCTVVDDGTLPGRRGSLHMDDEGTPCGRTVLIEGGVLKGYLHDLQSARLMGTAPTGNGRRQSYAHRPMPRMTNTFLLPGTTPPAEILASVRRGLYLANFSGGQVDITSGKFVFTASEAYRIEDGRLTAPVRGATLIGNGPDVLTRIALVGDDLALDEGVGTCGKDGQQVPVGVGLPTVRLDGITVGGTRA
jgi:TldD protein